MPDLVEDRGRRGSPRGPRVSTISSEMPFAPGRRIGLDDDEDEVRHVAVRDEGLRAVDHVAVAVAHRARREALQIGAGRRARSSRSRRSTRRSPSSAASAAFCASRRVLQRCSGRRCCGRACRSCVTLARCSSSNTTHSCAKVRARAAVLLGDVAEQDAQRRRPCARRRGRRAAAAPALLVRRQLGRDEPADGVAEHRELVGHPGRSVRLHPGDLRCGLLHERAPRPGFESAAVARRARDGRNRYMTKPPPQTIVCPLM